MNRRGYIRSANTVGTLWARDWVQETLQDLRREAEYSGREVSTGGICDVLSRGLNPYEGSVAFDIGIAERWRPLFDQHVDKGFRNYVRKYIHDLRMGIVPTH